MLSFVRRAVEKLNVDEKHDQVSLVQYSRNASAVFLLNTYQTKQDILNTMQHLRHKGGRPLNTGAALQFVKSTVFSASAGSRHQEGIPQILVVITGGQSNDDVRFAAKTLTELGVTIFVIGTRNANIFEIQNISQESSRAFFAADSSDFSKFEQQILSASKNSEYHAFKPTTHGKTC